MGGKTSIDDFQKMWKSYQGMKHFGNFYKVEKSPPLWFRGKVIPMWQQKRDKVHDVIPINEMCDVLWGDIDHFCCLSMKYLWDKNPTCVKSNC